MAETEQSSDPLSVRQLEGKEGLVIGERFQLIKCIGVGGFGAVYSAKDQNDGSTVAVKLEHLEFEWASIELEVKVYSALQEQNYPRHSDFFPVMLATGVHDGIYRYLVMEMLERSVNHMFKSSPLKLSVRQVAKHAKHLVRALEMMHHTGWIHGDLSLKNILIHNQMTRLVDFGLSNEYLDKNRAHRPKDTDWAYAGTVRFASFRALRSYRPTRRDDLESLAYILVYLVKRKLPWECFDENVEDQWQDIADMKMDMPASEVCKDLPVEFANFLEHAMNLQYNERPDYSRFRKDFHNLAERLRADELKSLSPPKKTGVARSSLLDRLVASAKAPGSPAAKQKPTVAVDEIKLKPASDAGNDLIAAMQGMNIKNGFDAALANEKPNKKAAAGKTVANNKNKNCENALTIEAYKAATPTKKQTTQIIDLTQDTPDKGTENKHYHVLSPLRGSGGIQRNANIKPKTIARKIVTGGKRKKVAEIDQVQMEQKQPAVGKRTMVLVQIARSKYRNAYFDQTG